jgi:hypothetical protein
MIKIYNHQYLDQDQTWIFILQDQFYSFEAAGLIDQATEIKVTAIGDAAQKTQIHESLSRYDRVKINFIERTTQVQDERITLDTLWQDAHTEDCYILYTHNKGITAWKNYFNNNSGFFHNYYHWRKYCEWGVIERWRDCLAKLQDFDIVGVNYNSGPCPHFSGNMWWSSSKYISSLDNIYSSKWWDGVKHQFNNDRMISEMWPCHNAKRICSLHDPPSSMCWPNHGVYNWAYLRKNYAQ